MVIRQFTPVTKKLEAGGLQILITTLIEKRWKLPNSIRNIRALKSHGKVKPRALQIFSCRGKSPM